jgi:hypothetical protein
MVDMNAVPEDLDADADVLVGVVKAKLFDSAPPSILETYNSMTDTQKELVDTMLMGAMSFGMGIVSSSLRQVLEEAGGG